MGGVSAALTGQSQRCVKENIPHCGNSVCSARSEAGENWGVWVLSTLKSSAFHQHEEKGVSKHLVGVDREGGFGSGGIVDLRNRAPGGWRGEQEAPGSNPGRAGPRRWRQSLSYPLNGARCGSKLKARYQEPTSPGISNRQKQSMLEMGTQAGQRTAIGRNLSRTANGVQRRPLGSVSSSQPCPCV